MNRRIRLSLVAGLVSAMGMAQEVNVTSTTMAQVWKQDVPGYGRNTYAPATEFLGIDATSLGMEGLSLHIYGWGTVDLADQSMPDGKSDGFLTYGYLQYQFSKANAEVKAGRFMVSQGGGVEQVDGVSARTDLRGGFTISAFGGRPVRFTSALDPSAVRDYEYQHDGIFGTRLGYRLPKLGEIGVSYLQDGSNAAKDLTIPSPVDYSRRQAGVDIRLAPHAAVELTGETLFDVARHPDPAPGQEKPSRIAEHDYNLSWRVADTFSLSGSFTERNFYAYFAGSNFRSLFRQDENDKFRAFGGSLTWGPTSSVQLVADVRHTHRETYGDATRAGADLRVNLGKSHVTSGIGYHRVNAADAPVIGAAAPLYSLSHGEMRAWAMYQKGSLFASVEGILFDFDQKANPDLYGQRTIYQLVGSLGYQTTENLKLSADFSYGDDALFKREGMALLRVEYRFGWARKGGQK